MLIDIGANLTSAQFTHDLDDVIQRSFNHQVEVLIVTGTSQDSSQRAHQLAIRYPGQLYSTAGVHPHDAKHFDAKTASALRVLATREPVVAVGECGLDYHRNYSPPDAQRAAFAAQIDIASELDLPLFMHQRDAHEDFMAMIRPRRHEFGQGVVHCFTGTENALDDYLALDLHIGITGWICDERRGLHLQELVRNIPLERLMIETDCPYLLPRDIRPKPRTRRNEPMYLPHIAGTIAQCMGITTETLIRETTETARRFFRLAPDPS
ncbi:MAG: TatD family hydrolase [Pseudomonadota bacterium]|nr:TatD family hydrolase [Pseudomonadota bacterium]MEE2786349.1 TatD family hydrolase [Myxococcota bacterium]